MVTVAVIGEPQNKRFLPVTEWVAGRPTERSPVKETTIKMCMNGKWFGRREWRQQTISWKHTTTIMNRHPYMYLCLGRLSSRLRWVNAVTARTNLQPKQRKTVSSLVSLRTWNWLVLPALNCRAEEYSHSSPARQQHHNYRPTENRVLCRSYKKTKWKNSLERNTNKSSKPPLSWCPQHRVN